MDGGVSGVYENRHISNLFLYLPFILLLFFNENHLPSHYHLYMFSSAVLGHFIRSLNPPWFTVSWTYRKKCTETCLGYLRKCVLVYLFGNPPFYPENLSPFSHMFASHHVAWLAKSVVTSFCWYIYRPIGGCASYQNPFISETLVRRQPLLQLLLQGEWTCL